MKLLGEFIVHEVLRLNIQEEGSSFHFIQNFGFKKVFHFALQKKFSKEEKTKQTKKPHCVCLLILQTPRAAALLLKANTWWLKKNLTNDCLNKTKQKGHKDKPIQPDHCALTLWGAALPAQASGPKLNNFFPRQRALVQQPHSPPTPRSWEGNLLAGSPGFLIISKGDEGLSEADEAAAQEGRGGQQGLARGWEGPRATGLAVSLG